MLKKRGIFLKIVFLFLNFLSLLQNFFARWGQKVDKICKWAQNLKNLWIWKISELWEFKKKNLNSHNSNILMLAHDIIKYHFNNDISTKIYNITKERKAKKKGNKKGSSKKCCPTIPWETGQLFKIKNQYKVENPRAFPTCIFFFTNKNSVLNFPCHFNLLWIFVKDKKFLVLYFSIRSYVHGTGFHKNPKSW